MKPPSEGWSKKHTVSARIVAVLFEYALRSSCPDSSRVEFRKRGRVRSETLTAGPIVPDKPDHPCEIVVTGFPMPDVAGKPHRGATVLVNRNLFNFGTFAVADGYILLQA